jgi:hypothetical protein
MKEITMKALITLVVLTVLLGQTATCGGLDFLPDLSQPQPGRAHRESSSNPDIKSNGDSRHLEIGGTLVLADLAGPGVISHIWTTIASYDPFYGRSLVIRIYWDEADKPSVEAPLGDFFGVGHGAWADLTSAPVSVSSKGRARNCYWRMPFRKRARVTLTNESSVFPTDSVYYQIDWTQLPSLPADTLYFHAQYRQAMPAQPGNYTILETSGEGHYAGTVYSVHQVETGWFGEGDDWFYIDGEPLPSLRGTGTEDYFGDAWGFRQFSRPFQGVSLWEGYFAGDRVSAYRWHMADPIPFKKSLKAAIEHRGSVYTDEGRELARSSERPDWVSSVAYWYQNPPSHFTGPWPAAEDRLAPYHILSASSLLVSATPNAGLALDGAVVNYAPRVPDARIEFRFNLESKGRYQINGLLWESVFGGLYQPYLDGHELGQTIDLCSDGDDPTWMTFDQHDLEAGSHTLLFEGRGGSPTKRTVATPMFAFGMVDLILLRLEDMQGYQQVLREKTKSPK